MIVILTGVGRHSDPWHALGATSDAVADVLGGATLTTTDDLELTGADVVVVNASGEFATKAGDSTEIVDALLEHSAMGGGILALHCSTLAFADDPRWAELLGGRWVPGTTMHPQIGFALVQGTASALAPDDFVLYDERYSALEISDAVEPIAFHTEDGVEHTLAWAREAAQGRGRVLYDGLGHGVESFDSEQHRHLLRSSVRWLAGSS